jgi:hypothetical protein
MKNIFYIMILITAVLWSGCEKESFRDFSETQVQVKKSNVTFSAQGGTGTIEVAASETPVSATSDQSWCKASVSGNIITVSVESNIDRSGRTALITLKAQDKINFVPVSQAPVYLHLDSYETVVFSGNGSDYSIAYKCDVELPVTVVKDVPWISYTVANNTITLKAEINPDFLVGRNAKIKVILGDDLVTVPLEVMQGELISSYEPDPEINTLDDFLNLKNNGGTSSRYKITYFSSRIAAYYANLKAAYPILQEMRIEAPRSSYKISVILYNLDGTAASYYYWNATNGLVPVNGSNSVATFAFSGNSYSGTTAPYTSNTNYTSLREFFATNAFKVLPDENNVFWFRSVTNPLDYFKAEPY